MSGIFNYIAFLKFEVKYMCYVLQGYHFQEFYPQKEFGKTEDFPKYLS